jgi:RNA polymerase sigma-54 factor
MGIGPRLDLRQSQTLIMTPQLRQAIKLLQFSNLEVNAFVEEELERNPLLERDERTDAPPAERAALDQISPRDTISGDAADFAGSGAMPDGASLPLDADHGETYDPGSPSDGEAYAHSGGGRDGRGGAHDFFADDRSIEDIAEPRRSLRDHLGEQLRLGIADPVDRMIGAYLIALLCPAGRLTAEPVAIAQAMGVELARVEAVRATMMRFDPVGLFARSLKECLGAQLRERNRLDPAMGALLDHLDLLAARDMRRLMTICEVDAEDLKEMITEIRALDPKPGAGFDQEMLITVIPDVLMRAQPDGAWALELNPETMPRVLVNQNFYARAVVRAGRAEKTFMQEQLQTANWLVKSLQQRAQTILKVSAEIVRQQDAFFRRGVGYLRPLILRDVATAVEMHESTVSRVTANKYVATPRGTFELKYFFTTAINATAGGEQHSSEAVRSRIRLLVEAERPETVLSDDAIVRALRTEGVDIARRTVAKYRDALRIPSSVQRKREKSVTA